MGAGDLAAFVDAGRTLFSLGLVRGGEGNLSFFDGAVLRITRTGCELSSIRPGDVLEGTLDVPPPGASSDTALHVAMYRANGPGAIAHAHPPGTVPEGWVEGQEHGSYAFCPSLAEAVERVVGTARGTAPVRKAIVPVMWRGDAIAILDQRALPHSEEVLECRTADEVCEAIRTLAVRGAPILGVTAAYALALVARTSAARGPRGLYRELERAGKRLVTTRPTAVNIGWAVERMLRVAAADCSAAGSTVARAREAMVAEAGAIEREDRDACERIGALGQELVPDGANVLTHCNTGMLCTSGIGTAQGVIYAAHRAGKRIHVWVVETRPVWQGARLTAWELGKLGRGRSWPTSLRPP